MSAIDADWNDFARQSVFLPWVHQTVRYLAVQTGQQTVYSSGSLLPIPEGDTLKDPQGQTHSAQAAGAGNPGLYAPQPGIYQLLNKTGEPDGSYAVNGSMTESDPATISGDEIVAAIERAPNEVLSGLDADAASKPEEGKKDAGMWWYLMWGIMALSFAELVLGNKTLRH